MNKISLNDYGLQKLKDEVIPEQKLTNIFDKTTAEVKKLSSTTTVGSTGTYGSSNVRYQVYIPCKPNNFYAIKKISEVNTVLSVNGSELEPAVDVGFTVLYYSTVNAFCLVKTGESDNFLSLQINTSTTDEEDIQAMIDAIEIYDISEVTE